ncbi:MAG: c-type cytochrome [Opitutaceae bacterium]|nr:c-type cytochrome [Opitutaceae bacterium]
MSGVFHFGAFFLAAAAVASAQGFPPAEAVKRMTVAPGFAVNLVASEPMMAQPVCLEFDARGRLWVVQYLQYPNPAGLKRVKVDRYFRTVYDKVPEPPPHGPRGADRVTILEDTNADGVADRARDFVNGLNLATSIAFGHGGVFVLQAPYLLFYPDRDGDDIPDTAPEVLLSGFGIEDAQSFANSLIFGPDGWLYGCQGSTVTAKVRGLEFQQAIWRYHPISRRFELFTEGGGNMWGLDYDQDGEFFASTNGGGGVPAWSIDAPAPFPGRYVSFRMIHMVQGAYYAKSFAKHGELHNPYTFGYFERVPAAAYKGFHVTPGGTIYQGDTFPPEYRGRFVANDLLEHTVQWSALEPWGTTFKGQFNGHLLVANDTWFAPADTIAGPDGAVYVADWSDQRMSHPDPDAEWDRSNGRVYRIQAQAAAGGSAAQAFARVVPGGSIARLSGEALLALLAQPNNWYVRQARSALTARRDASLYPRLRDMVARGGDSQLALEALWALHTSGGADEAWLRAQLQHVSPRIRRWAVRLLGDQEEVAPATEAALLSLAAAEPDAKVRGQLAATAARLRPEAGLGVAHRVAVQDRDAADPFLPLQVWWAVERHAVAGLDRAVALFASPAAWNSRLARQSLLPRLVRRYGAEGSQDALRASATLLAAQPVGTDRAILRQALEQGLRQRAATRRLGLDDLPPALVQQVLADWTPDTQDEALLRLLVWLGHGPARARALALAGDGKRDAAGRAGLIKSLADPARPEDAARFLAWVADPSPEPVKQAAIEALQAFGAPDVAAGLLREYPRLSPALRSRVRSVLLSRKAGAAALLTAVDSGRLAAREVPQGEVQGVAQFADPALNALVRKHWGKVNDTPEDKLSVVRRFNNDLNLQRDKPPGVPERGRVLYTQLCAACHRLHGEGGTIGPDLTTANRRDKDFMLTSLVDPSAVIRKEYLNYTVKTTDGRVLNGFVAAESAGSITLGAADGARTEIPRDRIAAMEDSGVSLMPEGLLNALTPQQLRDLFAWLQSDGASTK